MEHTTNSTAPKNTRRATPIVLNRRTLLQFGAVAAAVLGTLPLTAPRASAADDLFIAARQAWQKALMGGGYDPADPAFASRLTAVATTGRKWQTSMNTASGRTSLWADLPLGIKSSNVTNTARRLRDMAMAWAATGSSTYHDTGLAATIVNGLDWLCTNAYTTSGTAYDNWYEWKIATPQAINDAVVLLFDQLSPEQISSYVAAEAHYVPQMPTTGTEAAAANLALVADGFSGRGVLSGDMPTVTAALHSLSSLMTYAKPAGVAVGTIDGNKDEAAFFSYDGFYPDGSFIQHGQFPYVGGYGASLLTSMVATILRTVPLGASIDTNIIYDWIHDSFEPFMWNGLMMDTVRGRNVAFSPDGDHGAGHGVLAAALPLLDTTTGDQRSRLAAMLKQELTGDKGDDPMAGFTLAAFSMARALVNDAAVAPRGPLVTTHVFGSMDRVLHRNETFAAAVAMNSPRISNYETGNNENLAGWYTADGALYLYTDDPTQFGNGYWFTVDPYRIPGTTIDTVTRTRVTVPWRAEYHNPDYWAGGVADSNWGLAGLRLKAESPSTLQCRKSWFFFGNEILCLGDGITGDPGRTLETIIENRRTGSSATITIDGQALTTNGPIKQTSATWAHLGNAAGYVLTEPTTLNVLREERTGKLSDISPNRTSASFTNTFATFWLEHGTAGADHYGYVLLPKATAEQTRAYAQKLPIRVVERSATVHAARHETFGKLGVAFFTAGTTSFITAQQPCAVIVEETDTELRLSVSDPTQLASTVVLDLDITGAETVSADDGVTITKNGSATRISVDVANAAGSSRSARIKYVLSPTIVRERLLRDYDAGKLTKPLYDDLDKWLKKLAHADRKSRESQEYLDGFKAQIASSQQNLDPATYSAMQDLASRLVARIS